MTLLAAKNRRNRRRASPLKLAIKIYTAEYVPLRSKIDGLARSGGETSAITNEKFDKDYRHVGSLYVPYRHVMRIAGVMDAEQQAQLPQAQQQMAEFEAQMPESQRQMIMNTMGSQLEMMKSSLPNTCDYLPEFVGRELLRRDVGPAP